MPKTTPLEIQQLPFEEACRRWLATRQGHISRKTQYEYSLNIKTLSKYFGELRLTEIDADMFWKYQKMRKSMGVALRALTTSSASWSRY